MQAIERKPVDTVQPDGRWSFGEEVAACFDDMLSRSIPQYEAMRRACFELGRTFVLPGTSVVDLGCSRGEALAPYVEEFGGSGCRFVGVESSAPMAEASRVRFAHEIAAGIVDIREIDLRREYPAIEPLASLTLLVLTAQFIPIERRHRVLRSAWLGTTPGGALIVVEKVLGATADLDSVMADRYYAMKEANGYSRESIERKRASLEGVLVPVTAQWNEDLLRGAGFAEVDCFWRWMNFAAWIAVKAER